MLARVREMIVRFQMCPPGARIGVACSGGPDSVALLEVLVELAPALGVTLGVVHLNHKLRGDASAEDEQFVVKLSEKHGLEAHVQTADVAALAAAEGRNIEDAGRAARYSWFGRLIAGGVFDRIATGHTRSDQAETVLFRLLRGAGPDGLSAIRPVRAPGIIRPLLGVERAEVEAYLERRGAAFQVDESNADTRYSRNRIRHELLPHLERDWNPRVAQSFARLADQAAEDAAYWETRTDRWEARLLHRASGGLVFRSEEVARLEPALRRRLLRRALERVGGQGRYDFQHLESLRRIVEEPGSGARVSLPGLTAERSCGKVRLLSADGLSVTPQDQPTLLEPPDERPAPDNRSHIRIELGQPQASPGSYTKPDWDRIDWSKAPKPLVLRSWRPGDRICLAPGSAPRKIGDLLQSAEIAVWNRQGWPVLAPKSGGTGLGSEILWARGFGASSEFRPTGNIGEVLSVFEFDGEGRAWSGPEGWEAISTGF